MILELVATLKKDGDIIFRKMDYVNLKMICLIILFTCTNTRSRECHVAFVPVDCLVPGFLLTIFFFFGLFGQVTTTPNSVH